MKLLHAKSIVSFIDHEQWDIRRIDTINPFTGDVPKWAGEGPPDEIVMRCHYNGTETLTIEDAATDMNDLDEIIHNERKYHITEKRESRQYGFWNFIKCTRRLIDGI